MYQLSSTIFCVIEASKFGMICSLLGMSIVRQYITYSGSGSHFQIKKLGGYMFDCKHSYTGHLMTLTYRQPIRTVRTRSACQPWVVCTLLTSILCSRSMRTQELHVGSRGNQIPLPTPVQVSKRFMKIRAYS